MTENDEEKNDNHFEENKNDDLLQENKKNIFIKIIDRCKRSFSHSNNGNKKKNKSKIFIICLFLFILFINFNYLYFMRFNKKILPLDFKTKYIILLKDETVLIIGNNSNKKQSVSCFLYNPKTNILSKSISFGDFNINRLCYYLKDNGNILFFTTTVDTSSNEQKYIVKEYDILKNSFSVIDTSPKLSSLDEILFTTVSKLNKSTLFLITNENNHYFFDLEKNKITQTNKNPFQISGSSPESVNIGNNKILIRVPITNNNKVYELVTYDVNSKIFSLFEEIEKNKYSYYHLLKTNDDEIILYYPVYFWHPIAGYDNKKNIKKYLTNQNKFIDAGSLKKVHYDQCGILLPNNKVLFIGMPYEYPAILLIPQFGWDIKKRHDGCEMYDIKTMSSKECRHCPVNLEIPPVVLKNGEIISIASIGMGKKFHYSKLK